MPLKRLADATVSIQISLKAKKIANLRPCTGVRDKDGRVYALKKNQYYIYDVKCVFGDDILR